MNTQFAGLTAVFFLAATPALAVQAAPAVTAAKPVITVQADGITGTNLAEAGYPGGFFRKVGKRRWRESSPDGTFEFVEEARGETSVMLYDASRDYYIQIDLQNMQILLGQGGQQYQPLYRITRVLASGQPASGGSAPVATSASCGNVGKMRSKKSDVPVTVTFRNRTQSFRGVMWIDFNGRPVNYANLEPGQKFTVNTFVTHPWMFTDGPGNCAEVFMPKAGVKSFNITAHNPNGGDD
jgi:VHL beta domain